MINKDFYPTPEPLIELMVRKIKDNSRGYYSIRGNLLEPSAGKGDIIDYINKDKNRDLEIYAIEIEPDLQSILRSKEVVLVDTDFLNYDCDMDYDYIVMNPPFSKGAEHLLKAIDIATRTKIVCILNAETIKNPHTVTRKILIQEIEKHNGTIEFIQDAFIDAERKTGVEIALIYLYVVKESENFKFTEFEEEDIFQDLGIEFSSDTIAKKDLIGNMQIRYELAKKAYIEKLQSDRKYKHYMSALINSTHLPDELSIGSDKDKLKHIVRNMKSKMWHQVIDEMDITKYMGSELLKNFDKFIKQQVNLTFNRENVFNFFAQVMANKDRFIEQTISDAFDMLTSYGYQENRMYVEQWKTNNAYKVNKRVIAPAYVHFEYNYRNTGKFRHSYYDSNKTAVMDLDKSLCYISGVSLTDSNFISIHKALGLRMAELGDVYKDDKIDTSCESTFFTIKFYKKGTIHLTFKDLNIWKEFNYRACRFKNWLPNDEYKKGDKPYPKQESGLFLLEN